MGEQGRDSRPVTCLAGKRACRLSSVLNSQRAYRLSSRDQGSRDARLWGMAFGQPSGPPAPASKVRELLALLNDAGHTDFRDARGPMGFTQRQAGGKFTRDEADAFIEQLEEAAMSEIASPPPVRAIRPSAAERALRDVSSELLAAELQRRGWIVAEP